MNDCHRLAPARPSVGQLHIPSGPVISHQPFRYTAGLVGAFTLNRYRESDIHELSGFLHRLQNYAGADRRSCAHRRWEAHAIQSIVDSRSDSLPDSNRLSGKIAHQRERKEAVRNGAAVWRLAHRSLRVDVNPLPVFRRVGKFLDAVLGQNQPIRRRQFAAFEFFQRT